VDYVIDLLCLQIGSFNFLSDQLKVKGVIPEEENNLLREWILIFV